jgi:hypothetical protein
MIKLTAYIHKPFTIEGQFIGFGIKALTNGMANNVLALLDQAWVTV